MGWGSTLCDTHEQEYHWTIVDEQKFVTDYILFLQGSPLAWRLTVFILSSHCWWLRRVNPIQVCSFSMSPTTGPKFLCCVWMRSRSRHWKTTRCSCRTWCPLSTSPTSWTVSRCGRASCLWPTPSSPSGSRCSRRGPTWKASSLAQRTSAHRCLRWHTE